MGVMGILRRQQKQEHESILEILDRSQVDELKRTNVFNAKMESLRNDYPNESIELLQSVAEGEMVDEYIVPPHWNAVVFCRRCGHNFGPVAGEVDSCRWCWPNVHNRPKEKSIIDFDKYVGDSSDDIPGFD